MHSTIAVEVAAPPSLVFSLAHDVERWERLLPHYARSRAVGRRADGSLVVDFVARRPLGLLGLLGMGLPVAWRSRTWNEPATLRLRFAHVGGVTKGMDVMWRIDAAGGGSRVSIDHDFRPRVPLLAAFVDRAFTRPIAGRTLATFKALAEALAESDPVESHQPESDPAGPANLRT
jgi:ribosome-associated toxin RatA of RatAB toxin-antitoxin module